MIFKDFIKVTAYSIKTLKKSIKIKVYSITTFIYSIKVMVYSIKVLKKSTQGASSDGWVSAFQG